MLITHSNQHDYKMPIIKFGEKESKIYQNMCPPWRCIFSL